MPLNIKVLNKYIISITFVYGTIRECGLELRSSHKCFFFVADYLDVGFSISAMSDYV